MTELPGWATDVPGFDPSRWWIAIVCSHRDPQLPVAEWAALSICFDHTNGNGLHYISSPHVIHGEHSDAEAVDVPSARVQMVRARDAELVERPTLHRIPTRPRGSMTLRCPEPTCKRNRRLTPAAWSKILDEARRVGSPFIDMALID